MTRRAARMLSALEAGCVTRSEIFDHQGCFSLLNNAAAELRAAGVEVVCVVVDGDYTYRLADDLAPLIPEDFAVPSPVEGLHVADGGLSEARVASTPPVDPRATANTGLAEPTVDAGGQLAMLVAA